MLRLINEVRALIGDYCAQVRRAQVRRAPALELSVDTQRSTVNIQLDFLRTYW